MFMLERNTVRLGARPADKTGAIRETAQLLISAGYITEGYADSMLGREKQANTYLGNGIAIPHGMLDDKDKILKTGVAVLQVPNGVEWNPGETGVPGRRHRRPLRRAPGSAGQPDRCAR